MSIREVLLRGFTAGSIEGIFTISNAVSLLFLALAGILALYISPKVPYWLNKPIRKVLRIDFSKESKKQFSNILRWTIYVLLLFSAFYILGFKLIHTNPVFRMLLIFYAIKVTIAVLKPSIKNLDKRIEGADVSEGSVLMRLMISVVYLFGFLAILSVLGVRGVLMTSLAGAGIIGIVIGFGAQDLVSNMLSGIFIALDTPFKTGDIIEFNGFIGSVKEMGLRTTSINTFDNKVVTVPNKELVNNPVTNYTANETIRISVEIGVSYDSDIEKASNTLKNALKSIKPISDDKEPEVIVKGFGGSSIDLEGRAWINQSEINWIKAKSDIREKIVEEFRKEDVEIPFPTRVIIEK